MEMISSLFLYSARRTADLDGVLPTIFYQIEELEMQVQQLTRQLELSESLRTEAQMASNEAFSTTAQLRIDLAKSDEQLTVVNGQLEAKRQRVETLEKAVAQHETVLCDQKKQVCYFSSVFHLAFAG